MRLSRTSAVFPAPDGPASAVSRCSGKTAVTSCRLYRSLTSRTICPPGPGCAGRSRVTTAVSDLPGPTATVSDLPGPTATVSDLPGPTATVSDLPGPTARNG